MTSHLGLFPRLEEAHAELGEAFLCEDNLGGSVATLFDL